MLQGSSKVPEWLWVLEWLWVPEWLCEYRCNQRIAKQQKEGE